MLCQTTTEIKIRTGTKIKVHKAWEAVKAKTPEIKVVPWVTKVEAVAQATRAVLILVEAEAVRNPVTWVARKAVMTVDKAAWADKARAHHPAAEWATVIKVWKAVILAVVVALALATQAVAVTNADKVECKPQRLLATNRQALYHYKACYF